MININQDMHILLDGMGIIFYSPGSVEDMKDGTDFFHQEYEKPQDVAAHIQKGDIVGFCTGSSGNIP